MSPARRFVSSATARRNKCLTTLHKPCRKRGPNDHEHCPRDQIRRPRRRRLAHFDEFARAFEAFKDTNDSRLSRIETRLSGDVVTEEKLARIGAFSTSTRAASTASRSTPAAGARRRRRRRRDRRSRAQGGLRPLCPGRRDAGLKRLEAKALSAGSGPDGGYLVPDDDRARGAAAAAGDLADPRPRLGAHDLGRALKQRLLDHRDVGRLDRRDRGAAADQCQTSPSSLPDDGALRRALGDADPAGRRRGRRRAWIAYEIETAFAEQEGAAFVNGDGVNRPQDFSPTTSTGAWIWGKLAYRPDGRAGAFAAVEPFRHDRPLYALKAGYRQTRRS